jgi:hypothetical protein
MMEPAEGDEEDFHAWYRNEHFQQMSLEPAWVRTVRYRLVGHLIYADESAGIDTEPPTWFAAHEFTQGNRLGKQVAPLDPVTDWTKRKVQTARKIDAANYRKIWSSTKL